MIQLIRFYFKTCLTRQKLLIDECVIVYSYFAVAHWRYSRNIDVIFDFWQGMCETAGTTKEFKFYAHQAVLLNRLAKDGRYDLRCILEFHVEIYVHHHFEMCYLKMKYPKCLCKQSFPLISTHYLLIS